MDTTLTTDKMAKTLALDKTTIAISLATTTAMTDSSSREGTMEIILEDSKMVRTMTPLVQTLVVATTTAITDSSREEEDNKEATASLSLVTDSQLREFSQARTMGSQTLDRRTSHLLLTLPWLTNAQEAAWRLVFACVLGLLPTSMEAVSRAVVTDATSSEVRVVTTSSEVRVVATSSEVRVETSSEVSQDLITSRANMVRVFSLEKTFVVPSLFNPCQYNQLINLCQ